MVSNESRIRFHAAFELVLDELIAVVAKEKERDPENYRKSPQTRLLARIYKAIRDEVPADPQHASYYQGESEGYVYRQWRRARPVEKYRLFFKYLEEENLIIYAWLNSEITLSKYRSHVDAYRAFRNSQRQATTD
jgi:toxin YhaV